MSASTGVKCDELERPEKGADSWFGMLLLLGSAVVSLKCLGWAATIIGHYIMQ